MTAVLVPDGSCACSSNGLTCSCAPRGIRELLDAFTAARVAQSEAEQRGDAADAAHWSAERERLGDEARAATEFRADEHDDESVDVDDGELSPREQYIERQRNAWRPR